MLWVCFGLFNLIMANFVESTMENARFDEQRRHALRRMEHVHVARKLQQLMERVCSSNSESADGDVCVDRESFDLMLDLPEIEALLDDLDISPSYRKDLFDILDANGNGELDLQEIISGLMKVRGPASKSDSVASLLGVRAMHSNLRTFERVVMGNLTGISDAIASLQNVTSPIQFQQVEVQQFMPVAGSDIHLQHESSANGKHEFEESCGEKPEQSDELDEPNGSRVSTRIPAKGNSPLPFPVPVPFPTPPS